MENVRNTKNRYNARRLSAEDCKRLNDMISGIAGKRGTQNKQDQRDKRDKLNEIEAAMDKRAADIALTISDMFKFMAMSAAMLPNMELLEDIQNSDFDLGKTGFDPPEIEQLFNAVHDKQVKEDSFDVEEELKKPTFSQPGDIWILGRHRVICGDSTLAETYTKLMDGQKANLVLTDPPYNVDVEETAGKIMNDNMSDSDFYNFLLSAYQCMYDSLADDGSIYVWHADTEGLNFRKAFKDAGFQLSGCCIWKKNSLVLGRSPYQWIHEPCLFGWKQKGKHQWYADRKQTTVWEYDKPKSSPDHPTTKPIPLMAYPIKNSTMTNGIVLDPFLGSGSTLVACCETDRVCRGIELDPKFVDVIVKRYLAWCQEKQTAEVAYVLRDGQKLSFAEVVAEMSQDGDAVE